MSADPAALDHVFQAQGGFACAYKRLVALATTMLETYGGDSAARVVRLQHAPMVMTLLWAPAARAD